MPRAGSYSAPFSTQWSMKDPDMATLARNATGKTSLGRLRSAFAELIGYYERRRTLRTLAALDDRPPADIGLRRGLLGQPVYGHRSDFCRKPAPPFSGSGRLSDRQSDWAGQSVHVRCELGGRTNT